MKNNHTKICEKVNWPSLLNKIIIMHIARPSQALPNNALHQHCGKKYWKIAEEINNYLQLMVIF